MALLACGLSFTCAVEVLSLFLLCRLTFFPSSGAVFERCKMLTAVLDKEFIFPRGESTELVNTQCVL